VTAVSDVICQLQQQLHARTHARTHPHETDGNSFFVQETLRHRSSPAPLRSVRPYLSSRVAATATAVCSITASRLQAPELNHCVGLDALSPGPPGLPGRARRPASPAAAAGGGAARAPRRPAAITERPSAARPDASSRRCHVLRRLMVQFRNNLPRCACAAPPKRLMHSATNLHCLRCRGCKT